VLHGEEERTQVSTYDRELWDESFRQDPDHVMVSDRIVEGEIEDLPVGRALTEGGILLIAEWDKSMNKVWHFSEDELLSPGQIVELLPELKIERSEVLHMQHIFAPDDPRAYAGTSAKVAFVRARRR
jgi:hypothetical protein